MIFTRGKLFGFEFKWGKERTAPKSWLENVGAEFKGINQKNMVEFLGLL